MQHLIVSGLRSAGLSALLLSPMSYARQQGPQAPDLPTQLKIMKQELAAQRAALDGLTREVEAQRLRLRAPSRASASLAGPGNEVQRDMQLEAQRGTGDGQARQAPARWAGRRSAIPARRPSHRCSNSRAC